MRPNDMKDFLTVGREATLFVAANKTARRRYNELKETAWMKRLVIGEELLQHELPKPACVRCHFV
jgi:hypothetical protein